MGDLSAKFTVGISRDYGIGKSAGLIICDIATGDKIISMDIDIKPSLGDRLYYYGEAIIKGVLANEILVDKLSTISSDAVYKHRAKDIIDVYALTHCVSANVKEIFELCNNSNRDIQDFSAFFSHKPDIEHAYNKLKGIKGKPPFSDVYDYLSNFIQPFTDRNHQNQIWHPQDLSWKDEERLNTEHFKINLSQNISASQSQEQEKPSVFGEINKIKAEQNAQKGDNAQQIKPKSKDISL